MVFIVLLFLTGVMARLSQEAIATKGWRFVFILFLECALLVLMAALVREDYLSRQPEKPIIGVSHKGKVTP